MSEEPRTIVSGEESLSEYEETASYKIWRWLISNEVIDEEDREDQVTVGDER